MPILVSFMRPGCPHSSGSRFPISLSLVLGGIIYFLSGHLNQVLAYQSVDSNDLTEARQLERIVLRGLTRLYWEDYEGAKAVFEEGLRLDPFNHVFLSSLSRANHGSGDLESALFYLRRALQSEPENLFYLREFAHLNMEAGEVNRAISAFDLVLKSNDALPSDALNLIRVHVVMEDYTSAIATVEEAISRFDRPTTLLAAYAEILEKTGDSYALTEVIQSMIKFDSDDEELYYRLAVARIRSGQAEAARRSLQVVLELNPEHSGALGILRHTLSGNDTLPAALDVALTDQQNKDTQNNEPIVSQESDLSTEQIRSLLADQPDRTDLQLLLATRLFESNNFLESAQRYEQIVLADPRHLEAWARGIDAYTKAGQPQDGVRLSEDAILLFPGYIPIEVSRILALRAAGNVDQARELAVKILGRPVDPKFKSDIRRLERELDDA